MSDISFEVLKDQSRSGRHSYYISPKQFMDYTGFTEDDIRATAEREGVTL